MIIKYFKDLEKLKLKDKIYFLDTFKSVYSEKTVSQINLKEDERGKTLSVSFSEGGVIIRRDKNFSNKKERMFGFTDEESAKKYVVDVKIEDVDRRIEKNRKELKELKKERLKLIPAFTYEPVTADNCKVGDTIIGNITKCKCEVIEISEKNLNVKYLEGFTNECFEYPFNKPFKIKVST